MPQILPNAEPVKKKGLLNLTNGQWAVLIPLLLAFTYGGYFFGNFKSDFNNADLKQENITLKDSVKSLNDSISILRLQSVKLTRQVTLLSTKTVAETERKSTNDSNSDRDTIK